MLPCKKKKYTILRSPFVYKKTKEQFELRYFKFFFKFFFFFDFFVLEKIKKYLFFFFFSFYIFLFKNNFFFIKIKEINFLNI